MADLILTKIMISYILSGHEDKDLKSLRTTHDHCLDFALSQAALEDNTCRSVFDAMSEPGRILRGNGVFSPRVDLKDHLGIGATHCSFPEDRENLNLWCTLVSIAAGFVTRR
jgi:hypothetical protein